MDKTNERETIIRRADDEDMWTLWTDDPPVAAAMRRLAGRPGVAVREEPDGAVWATFPARSLKIQRAWKPSKPLQVRVPRNNLPPPERETIFQRSRGAAVWTIHTTSARVQKWLLPLVDGKEVTAERGHGEELVFTVPAWAVRIIPPKQTSSAQLAALTKAREAGKAGAATTAKARAARTG